MLYYTESRIPNGAIFDYPVLPSEVGFIEEGMPLVLRPQNGQMFVSRPTGGATDQFVGLAFAPRRELTAVAVAQTKFEISSTNLTFTDVHSVPAINGSQSISVWKTDPVSGAVTQFTADTTVSAGVYKVNSYSPLSVAFSSADAGWVTIMFNYNPTINDVTMNKGWHGEAYGMQSADFLQKIPVLTQASQIVTDKFVAADDWFGVTATSLLYITTGGYFTLSSTNSTAISNIGSSQVGPAFARLLSAPNNMPDNYGMGIAGITLSINM